MEIMYLIFCEIIYDGLSRNGVIFEIIIILCNRLRGWRFLTNWLHNFEMFDSHIQADAVCEVTK